jgi:thiamine pyrophosphate-dependent acetolactate synthase large subunit-like protein
MGEVMSSRSLNRRAVAAALLKDRGDLLVVTGLGSTSYDVVAAGDHDHNYYLWAAMGSAATVGFGLAMAQRRRPILVLTGDGEMLMGIGALATIAQKLPPNLSIAVLDNGRYGETGMQTSHTGRGLELARVAAACNFSHTAVINDMNGVEALRERIHAKSGTTLASIKIEADDLPRVLPPRDGIYVKNRFRAALDLKTI